MLVYQHRNKLFILQYLVEECLLLTEGYITPRYPSTIILAGFSSEDTCAIIPRDGCLTGAASCVDAGWPGPGWCPGASHCPSKRRRVSPHDLREHWQAHSVDNASCWEAGPGTSRPDCRTLGVALEGALSLAGPLLLSIKEGVFHLPSTCNSRFDHRRVLAIKGSGARRTIIHYNRGRDAGLSFFNSSNVLIANVSIIGCGSRYNGTSRNFSFDNSFLPFRAAVYFLLSKNVEINSVTIANSSGVGLALTNTVGKVTVHGSVFHNNGKVDEHKPGGGGVLVTFTYCDPKASQCSNDQPDVATVHSTNASVTITYCNFTANRASAEPFMASRHLYKVGNDSFNFGRGGGLAVIIKGNASRNNLEVDRCLFRTNWAEVGAGLYISVEDLSHNNSITVDRSTFHSNECRNQSVTPSVLSSGGGGAAAYFLLNETSTLDNHVWLVSCMFTNNYAYQGGGLAVVSTLAEGHAAQSNMANLTNCTFSSNVARVGAALYLFKSITRTSHHRVNHNGIMGPITTQLNSCNFTSNGGKYVYSNNSVYRYTFATVYIVGLRVYIAGDVHFENNTDSGMTVQAGEAVFKSGTKAMFQNNTARAGGGISLLGESLMIVYDDVQMKFRNNNASEKGGAIFMLQAEQHSTAYSGHCFVQYYDPFVNPYQWKTNFTFVNNYAMEKRNSIYITSVLPCMWHINETFTTTEDLNATLCWDGVFTYKNSTCSNEILTSPVKFSSQDDSTDTEKTLQIYPGEPYYLGIYAMDERNNNVTDQTVLTVYKLPSCDSAVNLDLLYISDNSITVSGQHNGSALIMVETFDSIAVEQIFKVAIQPCRPGTLYNSTSGSCMCSSNSFGGHVSCNYSGHYQAFMEIGFCLSYRNSTPVKGTPETVIAQCPYTLNNGNEFIPLPENAYDFCNNYSRHGVFCSKCLEGHGIGVYSYSLKCSKCDTIGRNWVLYH